MTTSDAPTVFGKLGRAATGAQKSLDGVDAATRKTVTTFTLLRRSAGAAAQGVSTLNEALIANAAAGSTAAAGSSAAASGYGAIAAAANIAAAAVMRFNAVASGGGAASASVALRGGSAAGRAMPLMLPAATGPLALAGGRGGFDRVPGFGSGGVTGRAYPIPGTGGPFGPGGGWGGGGGGGGAAGGGPGLPSFVGGVPGAAIHAAAIGATAGLGFAVDSVYEAAKLQSILVSTQNISGANTKQMAQARQMMFDVGDTSAMSPVETADMFREIVRQTQGQLSFKDQLSLLPYAAKMQVVLGATRGMSPHETTDTTLAFTHLFRQYDPKGIPGMMDTVLKMNELMPSDPKQALRQMTYFEPLFKSLNIPDNLAAAYMVFMSRAGLATGKGGTGARAMLLQGTGMLQMTEHAQGGKKKLLEQMGLLDAHGNSPFWHDKGGQNGKGYFDALAMDTQIANYAKGDPKAVFKIFSALGMQGGNIATLMADPVLIKALKQVADLMAHQKSLGLNAQSNTIAANADFAMKRGAKDFQALATEIGSYALPGITKGFNDMGTALHGAQLWLHQHPDIMKNVQKNITDDVAGIERFLVSHKKDWQEFGWRLYNLAGDAQKLGPLLEVIANGFIAIGSALSPFLDLIHGVASVSKTLNPEDPGYHKFDWSKAAPDLKTWWHSVTTSHPPPGSPAYIALHPLAGARVVGGGFGPQAPIGPPTPHRQKLATGGLTRGEGLAYLHRNELVINDSLTKRLDRMTRRGTNSGANVNITLAPTYVAAPGESDGTHTRRSKRMIRELANQVAAILADQLGLDVHAGGAIPQLAGASHFAIVGARRAS